MREGVRKGQFGTGRKQRSGAEITSSDAGSGDREVSGLTNCCDAGKLSGQGTCSDGGNQCGSDELHVAPRGAWESFRNDGLYPLFGTGDGDREGNTTDGSTHDDRSGSSSGSNADDEHASSWFDPIIDTVSECPDGVCPVPWAVEERPKIYDNIQKPIHYASSSIECIEAIKAQLTEEEYIGFCKGNIAKYLWREKQKGGIESVKKAQYYLRELLATMSGPED